MAFRMFHLMLPAIVVSAISCEKPAAPVENRIPVRQSHSVTGVVRSLSAADHEATIEHQKIPGYMEAMTMPFSVRDTNELSGLIPGEEVTFNLIVTHDDAWIENIKKTGVAQNIVPEGAPIRIVRDVEPLEIGDALPDYHFINEQGAKVSLSDFKGNALVLSFLFTRCPLPNFCPLTARKLAEVQNALLSREHGPTNWHILAITIDPHYDTPERLKQFGQTYGYNPQRWSFLTGELIDITALAEQFGLLFWTGSGTVNHNLRTVVVDAGGIVRTNITGNEWAVADLVNEVVKRAAPEQKSP